MSKGNVITGLDLGSQNIKVLVAVQKKGQDKLEVISQSKENSSGIRRGVIVEPEKVSNILITLFSKIKEEHGLKNNSVYINVSGSHLFSTVSHGVIPVSRADGKISETDIQRVLEAAQTFSLPSNKEIFDIFPHEFTVDGEKGIKQVLGLQGVRLEANVLVLGGFGPYLKNLTDAVLNSNLKISDRMSSPLAAAKAVLTPKQIELGTAVLDIGAGTTGLAVFEEGNLIHLAILPIGSSNITNDIAIGLKTDVDIAERIKIEFGSCAFSGKDNKKIRIGEEEPLVFSQKTLNKIIEPRVSEIFGEIAKELKKISKDKLLPGGIVLTGGGSCLPRITELAKKELKLPCRLGNMHHFLGLEEDPSFAVCCGLVLGGMDLEKESQTVSGLGRGIGGKIKDFFSLFKI